VEEDKVVHKA
jgi:hypothetical protein